MSLAVHCKTSGCKYRKLDDKFRPKPIVCNRWRYEEILVRGAVW